MDKEALRGPEIWIRLFQVQPEEPCHATGAGFTANADAAAAAALELWHPYRAAGTLLSSLNSHPPPQFILAIISFAPVAAGAPWTSPALCNRLACRRSSWRFPSAAYLLALKSAPCRAAGVPEPPYSYSVWCGVTTMVLCAFCIVCYLRSIGWVRFSNFSARQRPCTFAVKSAG